jgi:hypothetical protein
MADYMATCVFCSLLPWRAPSGLAFRCSPRYAVGYPLQSITLG